MCTHTKWANEQTLKQNYLIIIGSSIPIYLQRYEPSIGVVDKGLKPIWIQAPNQEPALELHSRAAPSVEAHHHVKGPDTGRNFGGRRIIKNYKKLIFTRSFSLVEKYVVNYNYKFLSNEIVFDLRIGSG